MSVENAKDFLAKMQSDSEFRNQMQSLSNSDRSLKLKSIGLEFTNEDLDKAKQAVGIEEMGDVVGQGRASGCSCYTWSK